MIHRLLRIIYIKNDFVILNFEFISLYSILLGFSLSKYSGYIDPASITVIFAMIVGVIVGAGMTLRVYWLKIKHKLFNKK